MSSSRTFKLTDILRCFPLSRLTSEEVRFLIKMTFRFAHKFGRVTVSDGQPFIVNDFFEKEHSNISEIKIIDKQYHHAKIRAKLANAQESRQWTRMMTVDEEYEMRTGIRPDQSLPIVVDAIEQLHVIESFIIHLKALPEW